MHRLTVVVRVAVFMALVGLCTPVLAHEGTFKPEAKPLILGNRIPQYYFVTSGSGDTRKSLKTTRIRKNLRTAKKNSPNLHLILK